MNKMFGLYKRAIIRFNRVLVALTVITVLVFSLGIFRLKLETDITKWLRKDDPDVALFNRLNEDFSAGTLVFIGLESDNIFSREVLGFIKTLTDTLKTVKGVEGITSLANTVDIKGYEGGIEIRDLMEAVPEDPEPLREYVLSKERYVGNLVSRDGKRTLVIVRISKDANNSEVAKKVKELCLNLSKGLNVKLYFGGNPIQVYEITGVVLSDIFRLLPIAIIVVAIILFSGFRSRRGVILTLQVVGFSTVMVMGLMGYLGIPVSAVSNIIPVLLLSIGSAYAIHFINGYYDALSRGLETKEAVLDSLDKKFIPIFMAAITTAIGFISFIGSYLIPINNFGIFTSLGVILAFVLSITYLPSILSILSKPSFIPKTERDYGIFKPFISISLKAVSKNTLTLLAYLILVFLGLFGITRLKPSVNLLEYFPPKSDVRMSSLFLSKYFGGDSPLNIYIKGNLRDPNVLYEVRRLEKFVKTVDGVGSGQSIADLVADMNNVINGIRTIPESGEGVANLMLMLEGREILNQMVKPDYSEGLIIFRYSRKDVDSIKMAKKLVEDYIKENIERGFIVVPASDKRVINRVAEEIYYDLLIRGWRAEKTKVVDVLEKALNLEFKPDLEALKRRIYDYLTVESPKIIEKERVITLLKGIPENVEFIPEYVAERVGGEFKDIIRGDLDFILKQEVKRQRVESVYASILTIIPENLRQNPELAVDIKGDISLLLRDSVMIPADGGKRIMDVKVSGLLPIYAKISDQIIKSQITSLAIALISVFLLIGIIFRSFYLATLSTIAIFIVILANFGIMGILGIPLNNATVLIASIAVGIGIDYIIHFLSDYRKEGDVEGVIRTTGKAIYLNALTVSLGFAVLLFANMIPLRYLGGLIGLTMILSALVSTTLLPSMLKIKGGIR
ncbi:MAG: MMPL family transporter [candidate division WOR-3 bacterium]